MASTDHSNASPRRGIANAPRIVPLGLKVGAITVVLLGLASSVAANTLARRERASLVEAKRMAADQATELFATYDAAALEFNDATAAEDDARGLAASRDVTDVTVFDARGVRLSTVGRSAHSIAFPGLVDRTRVVGGRLEVVRRIRAVDGRPLGVALVHVSLAREDAAYEAARQRIVRAVLAGALVLALALALALRRLVTLPLASLMRATQQLERGERSHLVVTSRDEVGELGRAFERMAATIADRETSLTEARERLQRVLDHMGQAILVFDREGRIDPERSREATNLVGTPERPIVDVLFPEAIAGMIEREAFSAWSDATFDADADRFDELLELAPHEAHLPGASGLRIYELDFRPVAHGGHVDRVMVLATDVTAARTLRADAERKDREHEKRVASMRRLVAGGGQVFVRFLEGARYRLGVARARIAEVTAADRGPVADLFRHVHTMRGEARCFDLDPVEEILAQVEFDLSDLRVRSDERYDVEATKVSIAQRLATVAAEIDAAERLFVDQSPVGASILDQVTVRRSDLEALEKLAGGREGELVAVARRLASRPFGESVFVVAESIPGWAKRAHKRVVLDVEGRDVPVSPDLARLLPGVLAHLVRNAIAHGLETPEERVVAGKDELGRITLRCEPSPAGACVVVEDDGRGFDTVALRARRADGAAEPRDLDALVGHGISTRETADGLSGHGVGLGSVRDELAGVGYVARIHSEPGRSARIRIEPSSNDRSSP